MDLTCTTCAQKDERRRRVNQERNNIVPANAAQRRCNFCYAPCLHCVHALEASFERLHLNQAHRQYLQDVRREYVASTSASHARPNPNLANEDDDDDTAPPPGQRQRAQGPYKTPEEDRSNGKDRDALP